MTQSVRFPVARFPWYLRLTLIVVGGGLLSLLVTAAVLRPSPQGFGTHQQLGLPPCTFETFFGMRCPSCGMTTSWSHLVRGRVIRSLQANCGGMLLGLVAMVVAPWSLASGLRGRWLWWEPDERIALGLAVVIVLVTLVDWFVRLSL